MWQCPVSGRWCSPGVSSGLMCQEIAGEALGVDKPVRERVLAEKQRRARDGTLRVTLL